ncbi:MAG: anaerobic ribonucleoside-triphosphate reductase activating protein [Candidatus Aerophobetes bacterium]|nr:anaerobic ribonucleoside-triphosphate reductase activating protein [Candidatus Aerophobetes bacterium]
MEFKGFEKLSLIEYPGKIVSVVFAGGCNFRCPFCQNPDLVLNSAKLPSIPEEEVINYLISKRKWLDGLAITGGEPIIHKDLPDFLAKVKKEGLSIELETNGSEPLMIKKLIDNNLIDYVAMDIKAPLTWEKYKEAAGINSKELFERVKESLKLLLKSKIEYEFRTTLVPGLLTEKDVIKITEQIKGTKRYVLQQFIPDKTLQEDYKQIKPYSLEEIEKIKERVKKSLGVCEIRGI